MTEEEQAKHTLLKDTLRKLLQHNSELERSLGVANTQLVAVTTQRDTLAEAMRAAKTDRSARNSDFEDSDRKTKRKTPKARKCFHVARSRDGAVVLPCVLGLLTIDALGSIVDRPLYHSLKYIFPVGFRSTRAFLSVHDPLAAVDYTSEILDGGDSPLFRVTSADGRVVATGTTPAGAWASIIKDAYSIRDHDHVTSSNGLDFFGFSNATVVNMIQMLPNSSLCTAYKQQLFEESAAREQSKRQKKTKEPANSHYDTVLELSPSSTPARPVLGNQVHGYESSPHIAHLATLATHPEHTYRGLTHLNANPRHADVSNQPNFSLGAIKSPSSLPHFDPNLPHFDPNLGRFSGHS